MAWVATRTWTTGEIVTAAHGNSYWRDDLEYLKGRAGPITLEDNIVFGGAETVDGVDVSDHHARHENGGADEISVAGLSGLLADDQHVLDAEVLAVAAALVHAARHQNAGADEINVVGLSGLLADDQNPVTHGVAKHTDVTRYKFYTVQGALHDGVYTAYNRYPAIELGDNLDEYLKISGGAPADYSATVAVYIVWACNVGAGNARFQMLTNYGTSGQAHDVHGEDSGEFNTANGGAGITNWAAVAGSLAGLAKADHVTFHVVRHGTDAGDTINANLWVLGVMLAYTAEQ